MRERLSYLHDDKKQKHRLCVLKSVHAEEALDKYGQTGHKYYKHMKKEY